jgi:riboflavin biosynthesis pyrimidine reductase
MPLSAFVPDEGPPLPLPSALRALYGGDLSLVETAVYANFVQSIDGVVAVPGVVSSGPAISGKNEADRFVMGLLRACASAVILGAATLRDTPNHHWTAGAIYPELEGEFASLRQRLGLAPQPRLVVLTSSGEIDVNHPAVRGGATFLAGAAGAERLRDLLPGSSDVHAFEGDSVPLAEAIRWLREQGHTRILSEAGPHMMGQLLRDNLVGDIFLTVSPVLAGRGGPGRLGLVEGAALLPERRLEARLASGRTSGDYLLLRYSLG